MLCMQLLCYLTNANDTLVTVFLQVLTKITTIQYNYCVKCGLLVDSKPIRTEVLRAVNELII